MWARDAGGRTNLGLVDLIAWTGRYRRIRAFRVSTIVLGRRQGVRERVLFHQQPQGAGASFGYDRAM